MRFLIKTCVNRLAGDGDGDGDHVIAARQLISECKGCIGGIQRCEVSKFEALSEIMHSRLRVRFRSASKSDCRRLI